MRPEAFTYNLSGGYYSYLECVVNISKRGEQMCVIYTDHSRQRVFCWTEVITFHFKQQSQTLAKSGVDVAGAYANKSSEPSVRKPHSP